MAGTMLGVHPSMPETRYRSLDHIFTADNQNTRPVGVDILEFSHSNVHDVVGVEYLTESLAYLGGCEDITAIELLKVPADRPARVDHGYFHSSARLKLLLKRDLRE